MIKNIIKRPPYLFAYEHKHQMIKFSKNTTSHTIEILIKKPHFIDTMKNILFPHDSMRPIQEDLVEDIAKAIEKGSAHIAHAPTGLGKTAASLAPAVTYALENKKKIFFLTSRHTQHSIAVDTIKAIKEKHMRDIVAVDLIGKQSICPVDGIQTLFSGEFSEYCKTMRADNKCAYYAKTRKPNNKLTFEAKAALAELRNIQPFHAEELLKECKKLELCPYEISIAMAKNADVIVADYYYIFNPKIRDVLFNKLDITLEDTIVIVDEAHNLPSRIRELMTQRLSSRVLKRAIKEANKYGFESILNKLELINSILNDLEGPQEERIVKQNEFNDQIKTIEDVDDLIEHLDEIADHVREKQKQSSIGTISNFLEGWKGKDSGFVRILSKKMDKKGKNLTLSYQCLDPSLISSEVINNCHSLILMSGTLTPTIMYKDILGFPSNTTLKDYDSPFNENNKLVLINPTVTTKYSARSEDQYKNIAKKCAEITNQVPGNSVIFFPSYGMLNYVAQHFNILSRKTILEERSGFTKEEKQEIIDKFKSYAKVGSVLLGVTAGSFGEGVDLPGDLLKCVVIVGLPLQPPTLEIKELIKYYDLKFNRGWDYGYTLPAISKSLQNAGRCIRTRKDKGIIAFLEKRYVMPNYFKCFPRDWKVNITDDHIKLINEFYN